MSYSDAEAAQAVVYWLAGMRQRDIGLRLKRKASPSPVSVAIRGFTLKYATNLPPALRPIGHPYSPYDSYDSDEWRAEIEFTYERRKFAANALNNWCRAQPMKPKLRLAASWVRAA